MIKKSLLVITILIISLLSTACQSILDGKPDKAILKSTLESSKTLLNSKSVGTDIGNVSSDSFNAYSSSISTAESIYNNEGSNQAQIDNAVEDLVLATTTFKNSVIGADSVQYLYSTEGTTNISSTILAWEYSTINPAYTSDTTYNPVLEISREAWNVKLKFSGITLGTFSNYATLEFKIKANHPKVKVIFDNKTDGSEGDSNATATDLIDFATTGTSLGNGWYSVSVDLSTLDATKLSEAINLTICLDDFGNNAATMYITDVCLKK